MITEKLRFLLETDASGAIRGFGQTSKALGAMEAGTVAPKRSMMQMATVATTAGAVIGTALLGAAEKFKNLALSAGKMADATGLSVEDASRWIEVAGDMGVESSALEGGLNRLNKTIGATPEKLKQFGVAISRTSDGAVDVNATFLTLVDRLNAIPDPAKRARVASELLGKGWTSLAELISTGSAQISASLAEVSDAKVIDQAELAKAKKYRESMDKLQDSMQDLAITVGESVGPALASLATSLAEIAGPAAEVVSKGVGSFQALTGASQNAGRVLYEQQKAEKKAREELEALVMTTDEVVAAQLEMQRGVAGYVQGLADEAEAQRRVNAELAEWGTWAAMMKQHEIDVAFHKAANAAGELAEQEFRAAAGVRDYNAAWDALTGDIDAEQAMLDLSEAFEAVADAAVDEGQSVKDAMIEQRRDILRAKEMVVEYGRDILELPPERVTEFLAMIDEGQVAEVERRLAILTRNRTVNLGIIASGGAGYSPDQQFADGGVVQGPKGSPQVVLAHAGETILPTHKPGGGMVSGGSPITITVNAGLSSPRDTAKAIAEMLTKYGYR